jgi:asparagine synthase (glutamine-hydrolysing)
VLAELSGGMDSTSIVCISDRLRKVERPDAPLLDTVSYFDDDEASLDERRYFSITEANRGKVGTHLDMAFSQRTFRSHNSTKGRYLLPGADCHSVIREKQFCDAIWRNGYRSLLSGIGGDELLGGVPDPKPELAVYFANGEFRRLLSRSIAWSLTDRSTVFHTLSSSLSYVAGLYRSSPHSTVLPSWLSTSSTEVVREIQATRIRRQPWEYTVQQLSNERTWWAILETLPHLFPRLLARPEYRYPFLDRDLVDFLMAIPRAQLLRPNRRRSLMRRALVGIVPHEVLERKTKAFAVRGALHGLRQASPWLETLFRSSHLVEAQCIQLEPFQCALRQTCEGDASQMRTVLRVIAMELWLQSENTVPGSQARPLTSSSAAAAPRPSSSVEPIWRAGTAGGKSRYTGESSCAI